MPIGMYEHNANQMILPDEFFLPSGGRLNPDNRWIVMASLIPWNEIEADYINRLDDSSQGSRAYPVRLALGSLIIKEKLGLSDEETVHRKSLSAVFHRPACISGKNTI